MRDRADDFSLANCVVLGASFDSVADNAEFARQQHFGFQLLSDADRHVGTTYDVLRPMGHKYREFPERVSYLIDDVGIIRMSYDVVDVGHHADALLADVARLKDADV